MRIRAHHLLCIQGFQGYGYSQSFVNNMAEIVKNINSNLDLKIEITDECDAICSCCPNNIKGMCQKEPESAKKIRALDLQVLKKLGLNKQAQVNAKALFSLVNAKLRNTSDIQDICANCEWKEKCGWFNSRK